MIIRNALSSLYKHSVIYPAGDTCDQFAPEGKHDYRFFYIFTNFHYLCLI